MVLGVLLPSKVPKEAKNLEWFDNLDSTSRTIVLGWNDGKRKPLFLGGVYDYAFLTSLRRAAFP